MGRSLPLDPEAVRAADDAFYARHPELVKNGVRQKLSATDPKQKALRQEWWQDYDRAAGPPEQEEEEAADETHKPAEGVVGCPSADWISIALLSRHDQDPAPYASEALRATLSDGSQPEDPLGGGARRRYSGIPCGSCSFRFGSFYDEIATWIDAQAGG